MKMKQKQIRVQGWAGAWIPELVFDGTGTITPQHFMGYKNKSINRLIIFKGAGMAFEVQNTRESRCKHFAGAPMLSLSPVTFPSLQSDSLHLAQSP